MHVKKIIRLASLFIIDFFIFKFDKYMKIKHYLLSAAMLLAVGANAQEPAVVDSNFYIFLCFGQSNM